MANNKKAEKAPEKYKTSKKPQAFDNHQIRPYDDWEAGNCPVCGWYYEGDMIGRIKCPVCGQVIE